jgi:hypothetical protein
VGNACWVSCVGCEGSGRRLIIPPPVKISDHDYGSGLNAEVIAEDNRTVDVSRIGSVRVGVIYE